MIKAFQKKEALHFAFSPLEDASWDEKDMAIATDLMDSYSEKMRRSLGIPVANEWSFSCELEGAEVIGEIDKIVKRDDEYHIIDFKSNQIRYSGNELLERYKPQLYLYQLAYEQLTGNQVASTALYVLRDKNQPLHVLQLSEREKAVFKAAVKELVYLKQVSTSRSDFV